MSIVPFLEANASLLALVLALASFVASLMAKYSTFSLREEVADPKSWDIVRRRYRHRAIVRYFGMLRYGSRFLDRYLGRGSFSGKTMVVCLSFAAIYPFAIVLLSWLIWGDGSIAGIVFFKEDTTLFIRSLNFIVLAASAYLITISRISHDHFFQSTIIRASPALLAIIALAVLGSMQAGIWLASYFLFLIVMFDFDGELFIIGLASILFSLLLSLTIIFSSDLAIIPFVIACIIASLSSSLLFVGSMLILSVVATAAPGEVLTVAFLFTILLPSLNAIMDYFSIGSTRAFIRLIFRKRFGLVLILINSLIDLGLAIFYLLVFIFFLAVSTNALSDLTAGRFSLDLYTAMQGILGGDARYLTIAFLMASTTIVPTFIHLVVGSTAIFLQKSRYWHSACLKLSSATQHNRTTDLSLADVNEIVRLIRRGIFWGWFQGVLAAAIPFFLLAQIIIFYWPSLVLHWNTITEFHSPVQSMQE